MHTKGPWEINRTGDDAVVIIDADCLRITVDHRQDFGNALPDAQLIAAAPELLEACKVALGAFEHNHAIDWDILANAIAKAEGRS